MKQHPFSERKRVIAIGDARVAYYEAGEGEPLLLLHGCPFSSFIWRRVIPSFSAHYRCLAPDLLGLGDTETRGTPTGRCRLRCGWSSVYSTRSRLTKRTL